MAYRGVSKDVFKQISKVRKIAGSFLSYEVDSQFIDIFNIKIDSQRVLATTTTVFMTRFHSLFSGYSITSNRNL